MDMLNGLWQMHTAVTVTTKKQVQTDISFSLLVLGSPLLFRTGADLRTHLSIRSFTPVRMHC